MKNTGSWAGPVIVGGVGGSGTRVVAEMLKSFGFFLGRDLNSASDNLTYTLLFKRPEWFRKHYPFHRQFITGFRIMEKVMFTGRRLSVRERIFLERAVREMARKGHNPEMQGAGDWPLNRNEFIRNAVALDLERYCGWGWKEPNSHLLLEAFNMYFQDFRYIHTMRHGLDMAYSSNQQQLFNWGCLFNITIPQNQSDLPLASFRYWVAANRKVLETGRGLGNEKFLLVNFDELCMDPRPGVTRIAKFLGTDPAMELIEKASVMPVIPKSKGRYMNYPPIKCDPADREFMNEMGFDDRLP